MRHVETSSEKLLLTYCVDKTLLRHVVQSATQGRNTVCCDFSKDITLLITMYIQLYNNTYLLEFSFSNPTITGFILVKNSVTQ